MVTATTLVIWWVRRDLRFADNPALGAAVADGDAVLPLFVLDPTLLAQAGVGRRAWLMAALRVFDGEIRAAGGAGLSVVAGRPAEVLPSVAARSGVIRVHVAADFSPYGRRRDEAVEKALADVGVGLTRTGSPYGVAPGTLTNQAGQPFAVFSPFHRAWLDRGVHGPAPTVAPDSVSWVAAEEREPLPDADPDLLPHAGEQAALGHWRAWLQRTSGGVGDYHELHDPPGPDATSRLSVPLRWGHLHPRTVLADLRERSSHDGRERSSTGALALARQLAWRDFFADALFHRPDAVREPIRGEFRRMPTDEPDESPEAAERLAAWKQGRTGYPMVDAGMRQLLAEGWMHNRVRMLTASFLVKDLHVGWWHGAAWFMEQLRDGDIAQNQMNWQWVAGCGLDAAPYFRIFNPTTQGRKFDADGVYVRRWVPELADVDPKHVHEPWTDPSGPPPGYPGPIVDHATERAEALRRYDHVKVR